MAAGPGSRIGPYEVTALIGEGGMGKVWRAHHTGLKRDDALKVLPDAFVSDPERLARFRREAQVLASLNHPNIAHVYGLEQSDGVQALVMELVEGQTLAERIAQGPIPVDEALPIARQIAEALEAAHEQGIVHRDLKPANVKLRRDATVKVLDFGLAKAVEPVGVASPGVSQSPTITSPAASQVGMLLGTAAYMSPEQAKGRPADKRSDLWAFGCVLYEMLTGARAFAGDDVSDTLAAVLRGEPDWRVLPMETPALIRRLLRRCLEKDRRRRLPDAADARMEIDEALTTPTVETSAAAPASGSHGGWRRGALIAAAAFAVGAAAAGAAVWSAIRPGPSRVTRTFIQTSGPTALAITPNAPGGLALTPDGSRLVYTAAGQLVVRRLDQFDSEALTGLGSPTQPFISPDGQWIGFFDGLIIKKVAIGGGPVMTVVKDNPRGAPVGGTFGADGTIVYAGSGTGGGLKRAGAGGEATTLTTPDRERGEVRHMWPSFLPGGRTLLFTIDFEGRIEKTARIAVLDLETGATTVLMTGVRARYLPSGHLVYRTENTLYAVAFDLERLTVAGDPVPVVSPVYDYDVAADGTLVYLPTRIASPATRTPVWVDRRGRETPLGLPAGPYSTPRLAPDDTRVAFTSPGPNISIWDLVRSRPTPGTFDDATTSIWHNSARLILGVLSGGGLPGLHIQAADRTGTRERLTNSPNVHHPTGITPDGTQVVFNEVTPTQLGDIGLLTLATRQVKPLVATRFDERGGVVSPDARWLAYESDRSGAYEVWVHPFPTLDGGPWQVSTSGGGQPLWERHGRELFYVAPDGALMAVAVEAQASAWSHGSPVQVIPGQYFRGGLGITVRQYDVAEDGQRFLMMKDEPKETDAAPSISVVQNWGEELRRLVPTK